MAGSPAKSPRTFLSYSYDGPGHRAWVLNLATRLREDGVETILDKRELEPGDPLPEFMEKAALDGTTLKEVVYTEYLTREQLRREEREKSVREMAKKIKFD